VYCLKILHDSLTADCSKLRLSSVPEGLPKGLQRLDLSHNLLQEIPAGSFRGYGGLHVLLLTSNKIKYLHPKVFIDTPHLQELDVHDNKLSAIPDKVLQPLVHLHHLDISGNVYNSFYLGRGMRALTQLRYLEIGSPNAVTLQSQDFLNIAKAPLQELRLNSGGPLRNYSSGALASFHRLQRFVSNISLDSDPIFLFEILTDLANSTRLNSLNCNLMHIRHLKVIDLSDNLLIAEDVLAKNLIKNVYLSSITRFGLIRSTYHDKRAVVFRGVPGIKRYSPLQELIIDKIHHISFAHPMFFINFTLFPNVNYLKISGTRLNSLNCNLMHIRHLKVIDLSDNLLIAEGLWWKECHYTTVLPDTTHLILSNNKFSDLNRISKQLHLMPSIYHIDLSYNVIHDFSHCNWPSTLHSLNLSQNYAPLSGPICHSPDLHILDMSCTQLAIFDHSFLSHLPSIKELYLQGNIIKMISPKLTAPSLCNLNLENNSVSVVTKGSFGHLKNISSLKLGYNPYLCTCELYWFRTTFDKKVLVGWPERYQCNYPENLAGKTLDITGALIVGLGYYFDAVWFIRMGFLWIWAKRRGYKKLDSDQIFRYHAFISYSHNDSAWVNTCLLPTLESLEPELRICIHERDFTPGEWIVDNIIQCIEQSSKVILVLSHNFVNSEWCHYELYFAQHRTMSERQDSLVLLLLEPLPTSSVPNKFCKLRSLLGKKTYLAWPSEESKRSIFWRNLVALVKADLGSAMTKEV
uniref:Toll-like receptor 18 n=1 Tax=Eptatretus burgeri TaxID=7764 RepID=A0A8C4PZ92_EPTBU